MAVLQIHYNKTPNKVLKVFLCGPFHFFCFSSYTITEVNSRWQQIHGSRLFLGNGQRECSVTGRVLLD